MLNDIFIITLGNRLPGLLKRMDGVTYNRTIIDAVDGRTLDNPTKLSNNTYGCLLSHIKAIEAAQGLPAVLIIEDDISFIPDFTKRLDALIAQLPPYWDALWLTKGLEPTDVPYNTDLRAIKYTWGAYAYVLREAVYKRFVNALTQSELPVDTTYRQLLRTVSAFKSNIELVQHNDGYSERMEGVVTYT